MPIDTRLGPRQDSGTIIQSDQGGSIRFLGLSRRAKESGLLASMGSIGDCYDNSMIESFWSRMQVELLDRKKCASSRATRCSSTSRCTTGSAVTVSSAGSRR